MASKNNFYAFYVPSKKVQGIVSSWPECERQVKGVVGAKYKGFTTQAEAEAWLTAGASYQHKHLTAQPGIYFDAGTGAGQGVEINVTDEKGKHLLGKKLTLTRVNDRGKHLITRSVTNNYGELLACKYALQIALRKKIKDVFGDSRLVIDYWSKGYIKREVNEPETVKLSLQVAKLRKKFEAAGGQITRISGDDNPADLGFHR